MQAHRRNPAASHDDRVAFLVGQDREGHWLAVETHGLGGGIFTTRDRAVRYARDESHRYPGAVHIADAPISLFAWVRLSPTHASSKV